VWDAIVLIVVAILAGMIWGVVPTQGQICRETTDPAREYCATHNIAYVSLWSVGHVLNEYGGLITAIATIFVAFFTYTLWGTGKRQARLIMDGRRTAHRQFLLLGRQTDLLEKQKEIARIEFLATHRPQITVHGVDYISVPTGSGDGRSVIGATIICFNAGTNGAAKVETRGEIVVMWENNLGFDIMRPIVQEFRDVAAGGKLRFSVVSDRGLIDLPPNSPPAICVGQIAYWDDAGVRRETGFCFVFRHGDRHLGGWHSSNLAEHVYEY
jgi:hypothetical protein